MPKKQISSDTNSDNSPEIAINEKRALKHLMDLLAIEGLSGREGDVAKAVTRKLVAAGCKKSWIGYDKANKKIPGDYEIGNLIIKLPGTVKGARRLFMGHLDTVPLCRGAEPVVKGKRIVSKGNTALGGDNRTAVAALVTLVETILKQKLPHPPMTVLLTVGEEVGLWGARMVTLRDLGNPKMGFNVDAGDPSRIVIGAIGADRWQVHVHGRSSHAGVNPEGGISAALIASRAVADVAAKGFFGKIVKGRHEGTSNVGTITGGEATNQVTDYVFVKGESRSHNKALLSRITNAYKNAFERAAASVKSAGGERGRIEFKSERDYEAFRMKHTESSVVVARKAVATLGLEPNLVISNGGLDANYLNAKGVPTVTLGAGQHNPHTVDEYVEISEYLNGCRLLVQISQTE